MNRRRFLALTLAAPVVIRTPGLLMPATRDKARLLLVDPHPLVRTLRGSLYVRIDTGEWMEAT